MVLLVDNNGSLAFTNRLLFDIENKCSIDLLVFVDILNRDGGGRSLPSDKFLLWFSNMLSDRGFAAYIYLNVVWPETEFIAEAGGRFYMRLRSQFHHPAELFYDTIGSIEALLAASANPTGDDFRFRLEEKYRSAIYGLEGLIKDEEKAQAEVLSKKEKVALRNEKAQESAQRGLKRHKLLTYLRARRKAKLAAEKSTKSIPKRRKSRKADDL